MSEGINGIIFYSPSLTPKPGTLLKDNIPVRAFADWDDARPGFLELDLVAHCGKSTAGEYLYTLDAVDMATGWCELEVLSAAGVGDRSLRADAGAASVPLAGIDSDNDSAFINANLLRYYRKEGITFTRSRP